MDIPVAATGRRPQNRRGVVAGYLLLGSFIVTALSIAIGFALAAPQQTDNTLAWMPLILPSLATIVVAPMLVAAMVLAIRGAVRERVGRIACIVVAVVSGVLALLLLPVAVNALFAMAGTLGAFG
ncbi:hypothetical protein ACFFGH_28850 [Lysobacter korlensis]|uniref:Major facilitator superfamily (MFS) profile domain-containing protein n=1 Tax=Lysobacter korlensis TaxID=553636 RepID=A0ABV6RY02_9GAMM